MPLGKLPAAKDEGQNERKSPCKVMLVPCACNPAMLGAATEPLHPLAHTHCTLLPYFPHAPMLKGQTNPPLLLSNGHTVSQVLGYAICKNH
jgi:hypothetical protein